MTTEKLTLDWCFKYPNARIREVNEEFINGQYDYESIIHLLDYKFESTVEVGNCKLILRPLSSLTDEELSEISGITGIHISFVWKFFINSDIIYTGDKKNIILLLDECRKRDFDIDNLKERGIAVYE